MRVTVCSIKMLFCLILTACPLLAEDEKFAGQLVDQFLAEFDRHEPLRIKLKRQFLLEGEHCQIQCVSEDSRLLIATIYQNGEAETQCWDTIAEKLLWKDSDDSAFASAFTADGKLALLARFEGGVDVVEVGTGKTLFTHDILEGLVTCVGFTADQKGIYAVSTSGQSFVAPIMEKATEVHSGPSSQSGSSIHMVAIDQDCWWKTVHNGGKFSHVLKNKALPPEEFTTPGKVGDLTDQSGTMVASPQAMAWCERGKLIVVPVDPEMPSRLLPRQEYEVAHNASPDHLSLSPDGSFVRIWRMKRWWLHDRLSGEEINIVPLPSGLNRSEVFTSENSRQLVAVRENQAFNVDKINFYQISGDEISRKELARRKVNQWLGEKRFDAIEELASRWDGRTDIFQGIVQKSPNRCMIEWIKEYEYSRLTTKQRDQRYRRWVDAFPDKAQLMRMVVYEVLNDATFHPVDTSTGKSSLPDLLERSFSRSMDDILQDRKDREVAWGYLETMLHQDHVPAETYNCVVNAVTGRRELQQEIDTYLEQAMEKWPDYYPIFIEEARSRVISRHKIPGASVARYAKSVADQRGGDAGDMLYARIFRHTDINRYVQMKPEDVPTDPQRAIRGFVHIAEQTNDAPTMSFGLELASRLKDEESARKIVQGLFRIGAYPSITYDEHVAQSFAMRIVEEEEQRLLAEKN